MAEQRINRIVAGEMQAPAREITANEARKIRGGAGQQEQTSKSSARERSQKRVQEQKKKQG